MRRPLGTAVFARVIGVTLFGIFLKPVFFYVVRRFSGQSRSVKEPVQELRSYSDTPNE
jgi:multidrug efflux pump